MPAHDGPKPQPQAAPLFGQDHRFNLDPAVFCQALDLLRVVIPGTRTVSQRFFSGPLRRDPRP
jgi:hypothetical protein